MPTYSKEKSSFVAGQIVGKFRDLSPTRLGEIVDAALNAAVIFDATPSSHLPRPTGRADMAVRVDSADRPRGHGRSDAVERGRAAEDEAKATIRAMHKQRNTGMYKERLSGTARQDMGGNEISPAPATSEEAAMDAIRNAHKQRNTGMYR